MNNISPRLRRLLAFILLTVVLATPVMFANAKEEGAGLLVLELRHSEDKGAVTVYTIPFGDDSGSNPDYKLLGFRWKNTAYYYVNAKNKYGLSTSDVINAINSSAETWDKETAFEVFAYIGITSRTAGRRDGYNVVSWGSYRSGVIAVTYIWYVGDSILETDMRLNTYYKWSLMGQSGRMDVQNIVTHEFGHWAGLDDLYTDKDYWLTMYGYSDYGETYKRTLGNGDILGIQSVYGS